MYNEYFGFTEAPFSIAPDPRYLYMSERHREALAHLLYGFRIDGGFVLLTGEVGTGKTTICRCLLDQVPGDCDIAFILNPRLDTVELLATLCDELRIPRGDERPSVKVLVDRVNEHLLAANAAGRKTVLIVDEAQNLSNEVLEQLRLLTNLETNERKLLQIMLLGQPELRARLAEADMRQLAQRIVARYHLEPLSRQEIVAYVEHRLAVAGCRRPLFAPAVLERLHRISGGTPRLINLICDRALLGTYAEGKAVVEVAVLVKAAYEVLGPPAGKAQARSSAPRVAAVALVLAGALGLAAYHLPTEDEAAASDAPSPAALATGLLPAALSWKITPGEAPDSVPPHTPDAPAAASAPVADTIAWPAGGDHWLHEAQAVRALFQRWQLDVPPAGIEAACRLAEQNGLACLRRTDDFTVLRGMNAPAIIELRQPDGPAFLATLLALDADRARLALAGATVEVSLEALRSQWSGRYTLVWRPPPGWSRMLVPGLRGADVAWVVRQLERWDGQATSEASSSHFTDAMERRVRAFQRAHGLHEDGMIGPMTLVRLTAMADEGAPVLQRQAQ